MRRSVWLWGLGSLIAACASSPPAAAPPATAPPTETAAADAGAAAAAEPEPEPKKPLPPVVIENQCKDVALLAYGEPPNMHPDSIARFAGDGSRGSAPRERDGTLAVSLVDDKGTVLARVNVSRRMKQLEIGRSCRTLYAH